MAKNETKRIPTKQLVADIYALAALDNAKNYSPSNADFTSSVAQAKQADMQKAQALETQAEGNWKAARDAAVQAEWEFHNTILGVKRHVISQFGENSNEIQALGLKKKAEYKSRSTKKSKGTDTKKEK